MATQQRERVRWEELEEEDFLLPTVDIQHKENYRRKPIENRVQGRGKKGKVSITALIFGLESSTLSGSRSKVGDSMKEEASYRRSQLTMISTEEFLSERTRTPGSKAEEPSAFGDPLAMASKGQGMLRMECRICCKDDDHLSFKCPGLDLQTESVDGSLSEHPICVVCKGPSDLVKDDASVRLTNLPKDTSESDLLDLVRRYGPLMHVYLAMDQNTDSTSKFAVVEYGQRKDAEKAISLLNGYDYYDNAILRVEWATPRPEAAYPSVCSSCMEASETCIRVTNISENITGHVFLDLFSRCGLVAVAYLSVDKMSRSHTQFGIVEYHRRVCAEKAIKLLNGFEFYDLAFRVEGPFRLQDLHRDLGM